MKVKSKQRFVSMCVTGIAMLILFFMFRGANRTPEQLGNTLVSNTTGVIDTGKLHPTWGEAHTHTDPVEPGKWDNCSLDPRPRPAQRSVVSVHQRQAKTVEQLVTLTGTHEHPLKLAVIMAFPQHQVHDVLHTLMMWDNADFFPCATDDDKGQRQRDHIDVVLYGADLSSSEAIRPYLREREFDAVNRCFDRLRISNASLLSGKDQVTGRSHNDYYLGAPAMFFGLRENQELIEWGYDYVAWLEPDVVPVRFGWLDALYEESYFMAREGIWQKGSSPHYAHSMDILANTKGAQRELFHINGNALYDFKSKEFGEYLRAAAGSVPNSFDFSLYHHRYTVDAAKYQKVTIPSLHRFQYSEIIINNPTDLCTPTLGAFLKRHPAVYLVHGKGAKAIRVGITCCNLLTEDPSQVQTTHSDQYHCLLSQNLATVGCIWWKRKPLHLSLQQIEDIATGATDRHIPHIRPNEVCFHNEQCCIEPQRDPTPTLFDDWTLFTPECMTDFFA